MTTANEPSLLRRKASPFEPVTENSIALFRLGKACNNDCRMCTRADKVPDYIPFEELLRRIEFLSSSGFRKVMLTGGEPTIHPSFWPLVEAVRARGIEWHLSTNGRSFAQKDFVARARREGLGRTLVSFHTHLPDVHREITGVGDPAHAECVAGIRNALAEGLDLMLNCVVSTANLNSLEGHVPYCAETFGTKYEVKFAYPVASGKAAAWPAAHYRYSLAMPVLATIRRLAAERGLSASFESFPNCILGDPDLPDMGRRRFGESHYLHDITGNVVVPMRFLESRQHCFAECCRKCKALSICSGISNEYAEEFGVEELVPF